MLKESEWNTINNILLDLYTINDIKQLSAKVLHVLRMMIPFSKGYFALLDENGKIDAENSVFIGFDEASEKKYKEKYFDDDYIKYLFDFSKETAVFRDSEILDDEVRKNTNFYKEFLRPENIPYGAGILLIDGGKVRGILNFFRSAALGDFSEKNIYVLNILKNHLENIVHNVYLLNNQDFMSEKCFDHAVSDFSLSHREAEILKLIADGKSNAEICNGLCVSISTVKKHVYNIFNKAGVNSRTQLLNQIYRMQKGS